MSLDYYNEIDPYAAQWLRNLIAAGHLPPGDVDERSIEDVRPQDLAGYRHCHFFAGIGGWAHALELAGWPDDRPVWTGSCPCQPFSAAGKGDGFADERHLWPAWQHLIAQCRPSVVFGEQVASKAANAWIDLVHADLEGMGYAFGCVPFPAASVGAPHIRDRNYWVAHADGRNAGAEREQCGGKQRQQPQDGGAGGMADATSFRKCTDESGRDSREGFVMAGAESRRHRRHDGANVQERGTTGPTNGQWRSADWLLCRDGKWRPVEPGAFPLAHGIPNRVGRLRAYGNAIVPAQAAQFIRAVMEATSSASMQEAA